MKRPRKIQFSENCFHQRETFLYLAIFDEKIIKIVIFDPKGQKNETALNRNVAFSKTSVTLIGD